MNRTKLSWVLWLFLLAACATSSGEKKKPKNRISQAAYFFQPGASYYAYIDLCPLRSLLRAISDQVLSKDLRKPIKMILDRTNRISAYGMDETMHVLGEGLYPKGIVDHFLNRHPDWISLKDTVDGFRYAASPVELGLPRSGTVYITTGSLQQAYQATPVARKNCLPYAVYTAMQHRPLVLYFPKGNFFFIKDNPAWTKLPQFQLLMLMYPHNQQTYQIYGEFTLKNKTMANWFAGSLKAILKWYKHYYAQWGDLLDLVRISTYDDKVCVSGIFSEKDMVRVTSDIAAIALNKIFQSKVASR